MRGSAGHHGEKPRPSPRVAYLLRTYPRFSQTFVVNEILELERQGLDLSILALRRPDDGLFHESVCRVEARAEYLPETAGDLFRKSWKKLGKLVRQKPRSFLRALVAVVDHPGANWIDLIRATALLRWIKKHRIDHVHVHFGAEVATVALLAKKLGGVSYSLTLHAYDIFRDDVDRALLAQKINASRFTVTVSEFNRRYMVENLSGVNAARIRVNYNGIDLARFTPGEAPRNGLVLSVGRLVEKKGFAHLVRAVSHLRNQGTDVRCCIVGGGREESPLREEIARHGLGDRVELAGPLKQEKVRELMQRASCFVLPCVATPDGDQDALPTVLLEAMACGCPVISTRVSGVPEIIEHDASGLLVDPANDVGLAAAIERIRSDPSVAIRLGEGGRRRAAERFDIRHNVALLKHWLETDTAREEASEETASSTGTHAGTRKQGRGDVGGKQAWSA